MTLSEKKLKLLVRSEIQKMSQDIHEGFFDDVMGKVKSYFSGGKEKAAGEMPMRDPAASKRMTASVRQARQIDPRKLNYPAMKVGNKTAKVRFERMTNLMNNLTSIAKNPKQITVSILNAVLQDIDDVIYSLQGVKQAVPEKVLMQMKSSGKKMPEGPQASKAFIQEFIQELVALKSPLSDVMGLFQKGEAMSSSDLQKFDNSLKVAVAAVTRLENSNKLSMLETFIGNLTESFKLKATILAERIQNSKNKKTISSNRIKEIIKEEIMLLYEAVDAQDLIDTIKNDKISDIKDFTVAVEEFLKNNPKGAEALKSNVDEIMSAYKEAGGKEDDEALKSAMNDANKVTGSGKESPEVDAAASSVGMKKDELTKVMSVVKGEEDPNTAADELKTLIAAFLKSPDAVKKVSAAFAVKA